MAKITVGIPLYNNERTIERCLNSVFAQSCQDFELLISNDQSTDGSLALVTRLTEGHTNCRIMTPDQKQYYNNFPFLVNLAQSEYFVWLAGDDYWEPSFLEETLAALEANTGAIACVPKCRHYLNDGTTTVANDTFPMGGSFEAKVALFFEKGLNNNRMYGLFRTDAIRGCYPEKIMHAQDFVFTLRTLARGDYMALDTVLMNREVTPLEAYATSVRRDHRSALYRAFPFLPATLFLLRKKDVPWSLMLFRKLLKQNFVMHYRQVRFIYRRYGSLVEPVYHFLATRLLWRL